MKKILLLAGVLMTPMAHADVTCMAVPSVVYAGIHGPSPVGSMFWVSLPNVGTMPIGLASDDMAKARFSMAQTAFVAKKTLILKYYSHTSCKAAADARATPTYAAIVE